MAKTVLIVDDQPNILTTLSDILRDEGYETLVTPSGQESLRIFAESKPDVVFLDVWLPDRDGLEILEAMQVEDSRIPIVLMSGHGGISTAVKAIKMGAFEYIEKPLSYNQVVEVVEGALKSRKRSRRKARKAKGTTHEIEPPPIFNLIQEGSEPQKTVRNSTVVYGLGLHSGTRTGMVLQPLPADSGIHFLTLPKGTLIPAYAAEVADTDYATTISRDGEGIKTVEHLLSALHASGVTNLLVKVHGEIPVLDGSALEFSQALDEAGIEEQGVARKELVIDREYVVEGPNRELKVEPYDGFRASYLLRYPEPIGEQFFDFELSSLEAYREQIAPARTFGFVKDIKMMNELGLGSGGRLDNFILVGEDNVINTDLRFPDEFVRHKLLDIIGDLYLLGYPLKGKVTARLTGHRDNIALLRKIRDENISA